MLLISHFYNEEFLLPFWIKHHLPMFDEAVLIDYGSTDMSVEIIRTLAPHWQIRQTRNRYFEEPGIGEEVMDIEQEFSGWKLCLNTTEFLFHEDIREYCLRLEEIGKSFIRTNGVIMVDKPEDRAKCDPDVPLCVQKTWGYMEEDVIWKPSTTRMAARSRSRLLHCYPKGFYTRGRHGNLLTGEIDEQLYLCWFGWSPFDYVRGRKKQIQHKASPAMHEIGGWTDLYCVDDPKLESMFAEETVRSYDLLEDSRYRSTWAGFRQKAGLD